MKCPSCGYENSDEARYCGLCQKPFGSFVKEPAAPYGLAPSLEPSKEAVKTVKKILRSQSKGPNWFQRHLNWTWWLPVFGITVLHGTVTLVYIFPALDHYSSIDPIDIVNSIGSFFSFIASMLVISIIFMVLQALATYGVGAWVLKRKNRSLWWLLLFVAPLPIALFHEGLGTVASFIAIIWFLRLRNYNLLEELPVSSESSVSSGSSDSIQPGLAPQGLGYRPEKYGP